MDQVSLFLSSLFLSRAEMGGPEAGNLHAAVGTFSFGADTIPEHAKSPSLDDQPTAMRARRVLQAADASRQIAGIDITQSCCPPDIRCPDQRRRGSRLWFLHLVIGMKRRNVPGYIGR